MQSMLSLADRTRQAMDAGFTNDQLARAAGVSSGAVSQWLNRTKSLKAQCIPGLVALTGWNAEWWANGKGPREWQAHLMSPTAVNIPAQIQWRELMTLEVLPQSFTVEMPDDSMRGLIERGTPLIFSTTTEPQIGKFVLIQCNDGSRHIRRYSQDGAGWVAKANNDAFQTFEPAKHGASVLAVLRWIGV